VFPLVMLGLFVSFTPPAEYLGRRWLEAVKDIMAAALVASGLAFRFATIGWAYIKRGGLNKKVYANSLVTGGYFSLCRNPLYLGNMMIYSGVVIFHGHPAVIILGISFYYLFYKSIIDAEEYFLTQKFGDEYREYCAGVGRWLPDFSRYRQATEGMTFAIKRSIAKDYTTIFSSVFALAVIEIIEGYMDYPYSGFVDVAKIWGAVVAFLVIAFAIVRILKKSGKLQES